MLSIHETVYQAPGCQLYGQIEIGEGSSVWPHCVIRAEANRVHVGDFCSITHHATIHGCRIEDECLIGIGAVVVDGAVIGRGSIVAGGAVIREGSHFDPDSIIAGIPAKKIGERDSRQENRLNAWHYHYNALAYQTGNHRSWSGEEYAQWLEAKKAEIAEDLDLAVLEKS